MHNHCFCTCYRC